MWEVVGDYLGRFESVGEHGRSCAKGGVGFRMGDVRSKCKSLLIRPAVVGIEALELEDVLRKCLRVGRMKREKIHIAMSNVYQ